MPGLLLFYEDIMDDPVNDIRFLALEEVETIHTKQLALYGGRDGYIDRNVVESALSRPRFALMYEQADIAELAATYLYGLATTQGFQDGNKRTATVCASAFLKLNGYQLKVADEEMEPITMAVAEKQMTQEQLADWIAEHLESRT